MAVTEEKQNPLTELTEEETLFQKSIADFAQQEIGPQVSDMDAEGRFAPEIIQQFFELGLPLAVRSS